MRESGQRENKLRHANDMFNRLLMLHLKKGANYATISIVSGSKELVRAHKENPQNAHF